MGSLCLSWQKLEMVKAASALVIMSISAASSFFWDGEDWQRLHQLDDCLLLAVLLRKYKHPWWS